MRLAQSGFRCREFITTVQPSLLGMIATLVPEEQSSDDFSLSWKIQTSSRNFSFGHSHPPVYSGKVKESDLRRHKSPVVTLTQGRGYRP